LTNVEWAKKGDEVGCRRIEVGDSSQKDEKEERWTRESKRRKRNERLSSKVDPGHEKQFDSALGTTRPNVKGGTDDWCGLPVRPAAEILTTNTFL
jgi:hypothetical protein